MIVNALSTAILKKPLSYLTGIFLEHLIISSFNSLIPIFFTVDVFIILAFSRNDFFRLSRKPFVIGISGDSSSGKDTLANSIIDFFGKHSVVKHSGDDYHHWDRNENMWQVMTHINPKANDLERYYKDLISLIDGKNIKVTQYDHFIGKITKSESYINDIDLDIISLNKISEIGQIFK